jgi:hypothetical protein
MFYQDSYVGEGDLILAGWQDESEFHSTTIWRCLMDCTWDSNPCTRKKPWQCTHPSLHQHQVYFFWWRVWPVLDPTVVPDYWWILSEYRKYARFLHGNWRAWMTSVRLKAKYRGYKVYLQLYCCRKERQHGNKVQPVDTIGCPSTRDHYHV